MSKYMQNDIVFEIKKHALSEWSGYVYSLKPGLLYKVTDKKENTHYIELIGTCGDNESFLVGWMFGFMAAYCRGGFVKEDKHLVMFHCDDVINIADVRKFNKESYFEYDGEMYYQ